MREGDDLQLIEKIVISGKIVAETGLHIGIGQSSLDIGGVDNAVLTDPGGVPYIPGSSLKGKLRSLLEKHEYPLRKNSKGDEKGYFTENIHVFRQDRVDDIIKLFGSPAEDSQEPARGIFRDSYLDLDFFKESEGRLFSDIELEYTDVKTEVSVDRLTASSSGLRQVERVPRGARFDFEFLLSLYRESDRGLLNTLLKGMQLLEDDYLGGGGTRGNGEISFHQIRISHRDRSFYEGEKGEEVEKYEDLSELRETSSLSRY